MGMETESIPIQGQSVDILNQQNIKAINGHSSLKRLHNLNPQANILIDESFMRLKSWNYEKLPNYDPQQQLSSLFSDVLKAAGAGMAEWEGEHCAASEHFSAYNECCP